MGEDLRKGEGCPQLLDLIPYERDWMAKEVIGGGKGLGVSEEKKLELRLGLPGGEDWPAVKEKTKEHSVESVLSLGYYTKVLKTTGTNPSSVGAKRGFLDTVESKIEVFQQQQQQSGFFQLHAKGKELSQKTNGRADQQCPGRKACGSPVAHGSTATAASDNAAGDINSSQTR